MKLKRTLLLLTLAFVVITACGKRGDPTPPVPIIPKEASDLLVTQRGNQVILSWSYPSMTTAGAKLSKVLRVSVYRFVETLPATATPPGSGTETTVDPSTPLEWQQFAKVTQMTPVEFGKLKERIASLPGDQLPQYVAGARIVFNDQPPIKSADGRPNRVYYAVTAQSEMVESAPSNLVSIIPLEAPSVPHTLSARTDAAAIHLTWEKPEHQVAGSAGYNVYRFPPQGSIVELGTPINKTPVSENRYDDSPPYGTYRYIVTPVRTAGPPMIEGDATQTVYAEFKDLQPPPVPVSLATLTEADAVRVVWDAVEAPDLAGYNVYRTLGEKKTLLTAKPIKENTYKDPSPERGVTFIYSVTSVDQLGNESQPAAAPPIMLPK